MKDTERKRAMKKKDTQHATLENKMLKEMELNGI